MKSKSNIATVPPSTPTLNTQVHMKRVFQTLLWMLATSVVFCLIVFLGFTLSHTPNEKKNRKVYSILFWMQKLFFFLPFSTAIHFPLNTLNYKRLDLLQLKTFEQDLNGEQKSTKEATKNRWNRCLTYITQSI